MQPSCHMSQQQSGQIQSWFGFKKHAFFDKTFHLKSGLLHCLAAITACNQICKSGVSRSFVLPLFSYLQAFRNKKTACT